jgi:hypothetical protein
MSRIVIVTLIYHRHKPIYPNYNIGLVPLLQLLGVKPLFIIIGGAATSFYTLEHSVQLQMNEFYSFGLHKCE